MSWVHLATQSQTLPQQLDATQPPLPDQLLKYGWRIMDSSEPPLAPGYERLARWYIQDPNRPNYAILAVSDGNIAEREAREAAEAAAREAERQLWLAVKAAVHAIDPSLIDKTPFADAAQKATIAAIKADVKALQDAIKALMDYVRANP